MTSQNLHTVDEILPSYIGMIMKGPYGSVVLNQPGFHGKQVRGFFSWQKKCSLAQQ